MARIFISYKRKDKALVFPVKDKIEEALGESCWIDLDGIESDAQFASVIIKAIKEAEVFLFMYSSNHAIIDDYENDWTIKELNFAKAKKKRIVFVKLDSTELSDWFEFEFPQKQLVDINDDDCFNRLINDIKTWLKIENYHNEFILKASSALKENPELAQTSLSTPVSTPSSMLTTLSSQVLISASAATLPTSAPIPKKNVITVNSPTAKEMYNLGLIAYNTKNYDDALKWCRKASRLGYAPASFIVGYCYENGLGVSSIFVEAMRWYRRAAEQGNVDAQNRMGRYYRFRDGAEAVKWYTKAAEQGSAEAQYALGRCFECGNGIAKDEIEAVKWYKKAAEQGDEEAKEALERLDEKNNL